MKQNQLTFTTVLEHSFKQYEQKILAYLESNHARYRTFAERITPDLADKTQVYSRLAFAILSANSPFDDTVKALDVAMLKLGSLQPSDISRFKMVPEKAYYLNRAYLQLELRQWQPKKNPLDWQAYRLEVKDKFKGLHLAKASFTLGLLYPTTADVACIDTWIQKTFLGHSGFRSLNLATYVAVESRIRAYAKRFGIGTFLAQWLIWDFARGTQNNHDIFPGNHKATVAIAA